MASASENTVIKVSGPYRKIRAKIQNILLRREDKEFLVIEHGDASGVIRRYAGLTDIMNFLHRLDTVLIPNEDKENAALSYAPVSVFGGCRF
jgi:hypothetical protein